MNKIVSLIAVVLIMTSCSSIKQTNHWKSDNFGSVLQEKILVVAQSSDFEVRKSYEDALAQALVQKGMNAIAAHKTFPELKEKKERSQAEIEALVQGFLDAGIKGIVLTALNSTVTTDNYQPADNIDVPNAQKSAGYFSLSGYYNNVHALPTFDALESKGSDTKVLESTTYILEAKVYNLSLEKEQQLVNVTMVAATDPSSGAQVQNKFTKIIAANFKK